MVKGYMKRGEVAEESYKGGDLAKAEGLYEKGRCCQRFIQRRDRLPDGFRMRREVV